MFFIKLSETPPLMGQTNSSKSALILDNINNSNQRDFNEYYDLGNEIGKGSFASVNKCTIKDDTSRNPSEYAVKIIQKEYLSQRELIGLHDEIEILRKISHKNIIKLVDVFDNKKNVSMVLELCNGQDLFDEIVSSKNNHFSEHKSSQITHSLSSALQYLHNNGIIHRDIKPENILFDMNGILKITDFGLAKYYKISHRNDKTLLPEIILCNTCCGTPHYVAPEIITKTQYNFKCDLWSLGVVLYIMLVGYQPFNAGALNEIYKKIAKGTYDFHGRKWRYISDEAKDLVECLLEIDPYKRYSTHDINKHPWIIMHNK